MTMETNITEQINGELTSSLDGKKWAILKDWENNRVEISPIGNGD